MNPTLRHEFPSSTKIIYKAETIAKYVGENTTGSNKLDKAKAWLNPHIILVLGKPAFDTPFEIHTEYDAKV